MTRLVALLLGGLVYFIPGLAVAQCPADQVSGVVYRDFTANGERDVEDLPLPGVTVRAVSSAGATLASAVSAADGTYLLRPGVGIPLRIEFELPALGVFPGRVGAASNTSVVFLSNAGRCDVSFGVSDPREYCAGPRTLATTCFVNGNPLTGGSSGDLDALITFPYDASGFSPTPNEVAFAREIGSTWGLAYRRSTQDLFASAFLKRHSGLGTLGTGGIYRINLAGASPVVSPFLDLKNLGIDTGSDPRTTPGDPGLPNTLGAPSNDPNVFALVGKRGLGDLEISSDERTLWTVNLFTKRLVEITIGDPNAPSSAATAREITIPNPGCSSNDFVPFGLTLDHGRLYVGVSCSAETTQNPADLKALVLAYHQDSFSTVAEFPLGYPRGFGIPAFFASIPSPSAVWRPFPSSFAQVLNGSPIPPGAFYIYPNAVVSSINFLRDGTLALALMDLFGHRGGPFNYVPEPSNEIMHTPPSGDLVLLGLQNGQFVLENNTVLSSTSAVFANPTAGQNNGQGPGGGERLWDDANIFAPGQDAHQELALGGLFTNRGFVKPVGSSALLEDDVVAVTYNPLQRFESAGIREYSLATGAMKRGYEIYRYDPVDDPGRFGKAAGLGDLEALCPVAPLEIGNRVWLDVNKNGIQDAGEPGISGVTVRLFASNGSVIATTTTASDGSYYFRSENGLTANSTCEIRLDREADYRGGGALRGLIITPADRGSNDTLDSDARDRDGKAFVSCSTGAHGVNDHGFDFGFQAPTCTPVDLSGSLVQMDSAAASIRNLTRQAATRIQRLSDRARCGNLNTKQLKKIVSDQEADYITVWNTVWSVPATSIECDRTPLSCNDVNLQSYSTTVTNITGAMVGRLNRLYNNACFSSNADRRRVTMNRNVVDRLVRGSAGALATIQGKVRTCER